jgi:hypothetical protein
MELTRRQLELLPIDLNMLLYKATLTSSHVHRSMSSLTAPEALVTDRWLIYICICDSEAGERTPSAIFAPSFFSSTYLFRVRHTRCMHW